MTPLAFAPGDFVPPDHASFAVSLIVGIGVLGVACGALIVWIFVKARTLAKVHAREEKEMRDLAAQPLTAGPHRVIFGKVDLDEGTDVAIQIDIDQAVHNHSSKNGKWHTWDETVRELKKAPFYVVRDDGETIYVDPPDDLLVVDNLETKYPIDAPGTRVRVADVRRGEMFYVYGDLDRGPHPRAQSAYRDGSGWILRSPRQKMLLATDAVRGRYQERISFLHLVGGVSAVFFVILHMLITTPFVDAEIFGTQTTGTVTGHRTWVTTNKNSRTTHHSLTARTLDGVDITQEVPGHTYAAVTQADPNDGPVVIPILETNHSDTASYLGFEPTLYGFWLFMNSMIVVIAIFSMVSAYRKKIPWYDRKKLDEHGGTGSWNEPRPNHPVT